MKLRGLFQKREWFYWWPPQVDGLRPKAIALRTKDLVEAVAKVAALEPRARALIERGRLAGEMERYWEAKEKGKELRPWSLKASKCVLRQFLRFAGNRGVEEIGSDLITQWKQSLFAKGMGGASVAAYLRRVQGFFTWLKKAGKLSKTPFDHVEVPSSKRIVPVRFLTKGQRDHILSCCDRDDLRFVLMAGFYLGLRLNEIVEAVPAWFITPGVCELGATPTFLPKGKRSRLIHYSQPFADFLAEYGSRSPWMLRPEKSHGRALYRWNPRKPFEQFRQKTGVFFTLHDLRHTFATLHIQAGTPIPLVAQWLGDTVQVTFEHYAGYAPTSHHVQAIV